MVEALVKPLLQIFLSKLLKSLSTQDLLSHSTACELTAYYRRVNVKLEQFKKQNTHCPSAMLLFGFIASFGE